MKNSIYLFITMLLLLLLQACAHPMFYRAKEFSGTVVDAETNKPLEGVVVVVQWILFEANFASGGHKGVMKVYEAVTDKDGKYSIPGWGPRMRPIMSYLDHFDPQIFVFKKGYQYLTLINSEKEMFYKYFGKINDWEKVAFEDFKGKVEGTAFDSYKSLRESIWDGRVIKLKRFILGEEVKYTDAYLKPATRTVKDEDLDSMLCDVYSQNLDKEESGISLRNVKYMAKEWSEAIKDVKKPFCSFLRPDIKSLLKEEFK